MICWRSSSAVAVEQHQRARDRAVGGLRRGADVGDRRRRAERSGGGPRHVLGRERAQHQQPAARADGRQHAARRMADQQQQRARRRLLQHLEQRVLARLVRVRRRIDDGDRASRPRPRSSRRTTRVRRTSSTRMSVNSLPVFSLNTRSSTSRSLCAWPAMRRATGWSGRHGQRLRLLHRRRRRIGMRQHEPRHAIGQRRLADAGLAADQPGVRDAAAAIGVEQRLLGLGMAEQRGGLARMRQGVFVLGSLAGLKRTISLSRFLL